MQSKHLKHYQDMLALTLVVLGNLIPLYGVMFWDWVLFDIFYLYWAENVMIGVFTILRMLLCGASLGWAALIGCLFNVAFFTLHYGMFSLGHGMILFDIFGPEHVDINKNEEFLLGYALDQGRFFLLALLGLMIGVLVKTAKDVANDRRDAKTVKEIMFSPYGRIIVLHLAILIGGLIAEKLGAPIWALGFLILLKIVYDVAVLNGVGIFNKGRNDDNKSKDKNVLE